ncbi:ATP-dependent DNA ligase [Candidatus Daviesbacteria bacterium]|nr:ATP-dependent DNA ligase [Candidatus Daviesbacteria bacterium]
MTFSTLAEYFEKLEQTSSRLSLIDILAELFSKVNVGEIGHVSYLIQGRVAPFYEAIEIGMSEKLIAAAIARAYGMEREEVLKEYGKVGDLGLVAQRHCEESRLNRDDVAILTKKDSHGPISSDLGMTVKEVFEILRGIAQTQGEGTVEKKVSTLADLLKQVNGVSGKHLVRIPLGVSRLGIGDPTILDAFALAKLGDRKQRSSLEEAYNKTSDLGLIGETLWTKGLAGVQKLDVKVGRPIRSQLAERLPDAKTILEKFEGEAHVQKKFDGFRTQLHKDGKVVRIFSRNLEETTHMFPELIEAVYNQVQAQTIILDAEALAYNPASDEFLPFQETTKRRRKYKVEEMAKSLPLKAFVFDIMYKDGKSLINKPLKARMEILKDTIKENGILIPQPGEIVIEVNRLEELLQEALTANLEGLVVKRVTSVYSAGARNFNWVKLKRHSSGQLQDTIDCVMLGYIYGKGKRAEFGAGALLVGVYDELKDEFVTVSKIGTGLSDEEWREIQVQSSKFKVQSKPTRVNSLIVPSVWVEPKIVIEVLADEITRSPLHTAGKENSEPGYALRFPRLIKFREADKRGEDATTVKELIEMYNQQFKR